MAKDLNIGQRISLTDGSYVIVDKKLGEGGQGAVYKVHDASGKSYALKWYISKVLIENQDFYSNLEHNIAQRAPANNFIWPLKLAGRQLGSYGYIMELRPEGFIDFGKFFLVSKYPEARFSCRQAQIQAALAITKAFRSLHLKGYSYKDVNDGNFFINPRSGKVLICDNDNVTANNIKGNIGGKARYMAAEVVDGQAPNIDSDLFSLAIILYRIFMIDHPFEGIRTLQPCLTEEMQKKIYGKDMVFCWDAQLDVNRPTREHHPNSLYNWSHSPSSLRAIFTKALSRSAVLNPRQRVKESEWQKALLKLRAACIVCPSGNHDLMVDQAVDICPKCKTPIDVHKIPYLVFNDFDYAILPKKYLYLGNSISAIAGKGAEYINKKTNVKEIGLTNMTDENWVIVTPSGNTVDVPAGKTFPLRPGMQICFNAQNRCVVRFK